MHLVSIQAYISKRDACGKLRLWSTTCGRPQSKGVANLTSSWHHFSVWDKILYSKALKGLADTWVTRPPKCVSVIIPIDTFLNSLSSFISATYRDCIKKYTHTIPLSGKTTTTKKTKGVKIKFLPFPRQNKCPPSPHGSLPSSQANVHAHTHFHTNTRARCSHKWREREMLVREVSGLWLRPHHPHPARFTLPWTNEATISGVFIQVAIVQIHKVRNFFFALSPHNFWIFSATTMGFSLRNWAAAALR